MSYLLQFFGYSAYQAQCLAPVLWFIVIAAIFYVTMNVKPKSNRNRKHK